MEPSSTQHPFVSCPNISFPSYFIRPRRLTSILDLNNRPNRYKSIISSVYPSPAMPCHVFAKNRSRGCVHTTTVQTDHRNRIMSGMALTETRTAELTRKTRWRITCSSGLDIVHPIPSFQRSFNRYKKTYH
jgi:hypothetical protein